MDCKGHMGQQRAIVALAEHSKNSGTAAVATEYVSFSTEHAISDFI